MKFYNYLIEKTMGYEEALKIMGLSSKEANDEKVLKDTYRALSMKNHPDRGGDVKQMQLINAAYSILKTQTGKTSTEDWKERNVRWNRMAKIVRDIIIDKFDEKAFINYLNKFSKEKFQFEMDVFPKDNKPQYRDIAGIKVSFFTESRDFLFHIDITSFTSQFMGKSGLPSPDPDENFGITVQTYAFAHGKKHKFKNQEWKVKTAHKVFTDPKEAFPEDKTKKIFAGESRKGAFKKRDAETFLKVKLKADLRDEYAFIPIGDNYYLEMFRSTFMRTAGWMVTDILEKSNHRMKKFARLKATTYPEKQGVFEMLVKLQKEAERAKPDQKAVVIDNFLRKNPASDFYG